jgi:tryptophan synthase alpha chain
MKDLLTEKLNECRRENRCAFVSYVTGGDPNKQTFPLVVEAVIEAGTDILEVGIPFSDPLADGEANQLAAERALSNGVTTTFVLESISETRKKHPFLPIIIFTYINPIVFAGNFSFDEFCAAAAKSGVNGILCLDITPEEDKNMGGFYSKTLKKNNIFSVSLVAPTTLESRISKLAKFATGLIYYVSREGVTGESENFSGAFADRIALIKKYSKLPVVVGFGISSEEHVRIAASTNVDGVVVGSAIVRKIEALSKGKENLEGIKNFVTQLKKGTYYG